MSTDYYISIHRKKDNKLIGTMLCNHLKSIFDSEYSSKIGCGDRMSAHNKTFVCNNLHDISESVESDIAKKYDAILEKKLMITCAANVDIKESLEDDITYIKDDISDLHLVKDSANFIIGAIMTLVENNVKNPKKFDDVKDDEIDTHNVLAYEYNTEDLNEGKDKSDAREYVWVDDVYCVIEAC